jgi:hypothetical protein
MSPLAHEIYRQLLRHLRSGSASITYAELAAAVSKKHPTHHRSPSFHTALGEVTDACRAAKLPCLPAIVWRAAGQRPGGGYYKAAHPRARSEQSQLAAWEREHADVVRDAARFPASLPV